MAAQSYTRNVFNVREGRWREVLCANSAACKVYMHIHKHLYICKYANVAFVNMQMHMFVCICTCMNIYVYMQEGWSRYTCTHMHTQMVWHNTNELLKEGYCKTFRHTIAYTCIDACTLTCLDADGVAQHQRAPQGGLLRDQDGRHPCHRVCLPSEFTQVTICICMNICKYMCIQTYDIDMHLHIYILVYNYPYMQVLPGV